MDILRETVEKSDHDKKSYRVIKLGNGLKALLISEPSSLKTGATGPRENFASCGLNISIGSFSDPKDIHGLAHFVSKFQKNNKVITTKSLMFPYLFLQTVLFQRVRINIHQRMNLLISCTNTVVSIITIPIRMKQNSP